jgi:hypothetical protein
MLYNDVAPNPPPITRKPSKPQLPMIKPKVRNLFSSRTEGKLINLLEHLEQQTITKTQFQKSQIRRTKMAVGVEALVSYNKNKNKVLLRTVYN